MGKNIRRIAVLLTLTLSIIIYSDRVFSANLQFITEELPPNNYTEKGELKGIAVELLGEIWKRMGQPAQPIMVLPWPQGYEQALKKPGTVLFSMARLRTRENTFKWAGPIRPLRFALFARKGKIKPESLRDLKQFRFGAIVNEAGEYLLIEQGVPVKNIDRSSTNAKMVNKLATGKVDMIAFSELATRELFETKGLDPKQYEIVGTLSGSSLWYAFHKDTSDDVVNAYQQAINAIKADGTYDKILARYKNRK